MGDYFERSRVFNGFILLRESDQELSKKINECKKVYIALLLKKKREEKCSIRMLCVFVKVKDIRISKRAKISNSKY